MADFASGTILLYFRFLFYVFVVLAVDELSLVSEQLASE